MKGACAKLGCDTGARRDGLCSNHLAVFCTGGKPGCAKQAESSGGMCYPCKHPCNSDDHIKTNVSARKGCKYNGIEMCYLCYQLAIARGADVKEKKNVEPEVEAGAGPVVNPGATGRDSKAHWSPTPDKAPWAGHTVDDDNSDYYGRMYWYNKQTGQSVWGGPVRTAVTTPPHTHTPAHLSVCGPRGDRFECGGRITFRYHMRSGVGV